MLEERLMNNQGSPRRLYTMQFLSSLPVTGTVAFVLIFESGILAEFPGSGQSVWPLWAHLVAGSLYLLPIFYLLQLNKWLFAATLPSLVILAATASWYIRKFGVVVSGEVLAAIATTNTGEATEFLSAEILLWILPAMLLSAGLIYWRFRQPRRAGSRSRVVVVTSLILVLLIFTRFWLVPTDYLFKPFNPGIIKSPGDARQLKDLAARLWPGDVASPVKKIRVKGGRVKFETLNQRNAHRLRLYAGKGDFSLREKYLERTFDRSGKHLETSLIQSSLWRGLRPKDFLLYRMASAVQQFVSYQVALAQAKSSLEDISILPSTLNMNRAKDLTVVLVIGESARADRFGLNGYDRQTTPKLAAIPNLISFPNTTSCAASSTVAVPCMLTRMATSDLPEEYQKSDQKAYAYDLIARENSFISLFAKHGYSSTWLSLNPVGGRKNEPVSVLIGDAQQKLFLSDLDVPYAKSRDKLLLKPLQDVLAKQQGRSLIILHTRGSHWRYSARYPVSFNQFTPDCKRGAPADCNKTELNNAYDNTIVYTDHFLSQVISLLKKRKSVFLYSADHGESLGEGGFYTHSVMSRPEQRQVPMIWWASDSFIAKNKPIQNHLVSRKLDNVSHDSIFHSLLDCAGISSEVVDRKLSFCAN
jgi:glucan phosphoethanolaminetransferase (alkaline phosphatase superfamily)